MILSNENISYENKWRKLKTISEPAMLIVALIHLGQLLSRGGETNVFKPLGIGVKEFEALFIIKHKPRATPTDIYKTSLTQPAKATRVLDRLEKHKLIDRKPLPKDRRSYYLILSKKGEETLSGAIAAFKKSAEALQDAIGPATVRTLVQYVTGIINHLGGKSL